jgi:hypothetical protein
MAPTQFLFPDEISTFKTLSTYSIPINMSKIQPIYVLKQDN